MATTIKLKNSVTATNAPSSLVQGEVAINVTDKKVWVGNAATTPIQLLGTGATGNFSALTCTTLTASGATTFTAGTASTSTTTGTAVITGGLGVSGRINAANFDGIVGANTAAAGNFTTLGATGVATFSAGTAALPAITTTGDTNTGIFFPAADTIAFTEGGVEAMRIDSSGRLLVGTTAVTTSSGQSGEIYSTGGTGFMMTNTTAANYPLSVKNEGTSSTRNLIQFLEGTAGGSSRANISFDGSANTFIQTSGATALLFGTNNTERMRIDSSGNVLVNTTSSTGHKMTVQSAAGAGGIDCVGGATNGYYAMRVDMPSTNTYGVLFRNNGNNVGDIRINSSSTAYNTSSDYRLKENVAPMTGALAKVAQLKPVTYTWKATGETSQGFIAHELQAVVPDCVTGKKDAIDEEGNPVHQGVDTSFLVATLTAALQEAHGLIKDLQARVDALESK